MPDVEIERHTDPTLVLHVRIYLCSVREPGPVVTFPDHYAPSAPHIIVGDGERRLGFPASRGALHSPWWWISLIVQSARYESITVGPGATARILLQTARGTINMPCGARVTPTRFERNKDK